MRAAAEQLIVTSQTPSVDDFVALATACRNLGDLDAASDAAERASDCAPGLPETTMLRALVAGERGDGDLAILRYRELAACAPDNPRWAYEIVRLLEMLGRVEEAAGELDDALGRMPADPLLWNIALDSGFRTLQDAAGSGLSLVGQGLYAALRDRAPAEAQLQRPPLADHKLGDVMLAPPPPGNTLVVVFTGNNDTVGMPLPIFDRYLAALGVSAVYLKDFRRLLYLRGVRSLGDRTATLHALRRLQCELGCRRLCTIGASTGGFAAIRYGVELGADRILSFAGLSHRSAALGGTAVQLQHEANHLAKGELDLQAFLSGRCYRSRILLIYGDREPRDRPHALYLAGLDGVTAHPIPELNDHQCLRWLALHRDLRGLLGEWLAV